MIGDNWGATAAECVRPLPCDDILPHASIRLHRAISIDAPAAVVFAWLCQLRVAPYSYDLLDNLGRRSPRELGPGLTELAPGQRFMSVFSLASYATDEHVTLRRRRVAVTYAITTDARTARLVVRVLFDIPGGRLAAAAGRPLALGDGVMMRKQLRTLKARAESGVGRATRVAEPFR